MTAERQRYRVDIPAATMVVEVEDERHAWTQAYVDLDTSDWTVTPLPTRREVVARAVRGYTQVGSRWDDVPGPVQDAYLCQADYVLAALDEWEDRESE